jgi:hypothetical protein
MDGSSKEEEEEEEEEEEDGIFTSISLGDDTGEEETDVLANRPFSNC